MNSTSHQIISGGGEGQVRVWDVLSDHNQKMKEALKEHKGMFGSLIKS